MKKILILQINSLTLKFNLQYYFFQPYETSIRRSGAAGERVFRVFAIDDDIGDNGQVVYEIRDHANCPDCFDIDEDTGWVTRTSNSIPGQVSPKIEVLNSSRDQLAGKFHKVT